VFVEIAQNELGVGLILGGARLEPGERLIVAGRSGIGGDEELLELEASGCIPRIGAKGEFGDRGSGNGDGLPERGGGSGIPGEREATNSKKEPGDAIGVKRECRHVDPLLWVLDADSCDPSATRLSGREIARM
jgi:hypothetical protein